MICPQCEHFFAVVGVREIVEVEPVDVDTTAESVPPKSNESTSGQLA